MGKKRGPHHRGSYQTRAKQVRDQANYDPATRCWRCGELRRAGDPWQAGHINDGQVDGPLAAEHASCNARAGQILSTQRRKKWTTTRTW